MTVSIKKNYIIKIIFIIFIPLFFVACANIVAPTGGAKDIQAPKVLKCVPQNYSTNFKETKIRIFFDEFIKLNNINNQSIISPTLDKLPDFNLKGKSIIISFNEKLKDNTTYTIYFGDAIADITENNILSNFQYVLSTGNSLDSLTVKGKITDAFTTKPEEDVIVMLYKNIYDSVPYKERPLYITKPNKSGDFVFSNLKNGIYKMFALKDENNNYIYDMPNEIIAFKDSVISPEIIDTVRKDSSKNTIYNLFLFKETDTIQKLIKTNIYHERKLTFIFKHPTVNVKITPLNCKFENKWNIKDLNPGKDTLIYWLTNVDNDSLILEIRDNNIILDTVEFALKHKTKSKLSGKRADISDKFLYKININKNKVFDFYKPVFLNISRPVKEYALSKIVCLRQTETEDTIIKDTIRPQISFADSILKKTEINYKWKESQSYHIFIPPSTFKDIYNYTNDTINIYFKTQSLKYYGTIKLNINIPETKNVYIIQLLNEKEKILKQDIIKQDETIIYEYLKPATYKLKIIQDSNNNGKWDTGNYLKNVRPEQVKYYDSIIKTRSNWDMDIDWDVE